LKALLSGFNKEIRLHVGGLNIKKELTDEQVSIANSQCLWGQKKSRNGFKVSDHIDPNLVARI
jgi:hypothetical protein